MSQCVSSSESTSTSVRRLPANARVSGSARLMTSRAADTASGFTLSSYSTVTGIVVSPYRLARTPADKFYFDRFAVAESGVADARECRCRRQFVAATRSIIDGYMRLAGGLL